MLGGLGSTLVNITDVYFVVVIVIIIVVVVCCCQSYLYYCAGGAVITGSTSTVDYITASDVVTFAAGSGPNNVETSNTLVTLNDDIYVEENIETADILGSVQGSVGTFNNPNPATLQILDNDGKQKSVGKYNYIYRSGVGWGGVGWGE